MATTKGKMMGIKVLDTLLPCPFCGQTKTLDEITGQEFMDDEQDFWQHSDSCAIVCDASTGGKGGCGAMGGFAATEQLAVTKWNTRMTPFHERKDDGI